MLNDKIVLPPEPPPWNLSEILQQSEPGPASKEDACTDSAIEAWRTSAAHPPVCSGGGARTKKNENGGDIRH